MKHSLIATFVAVNLLVACGPGGGTDAGTDGPDTTCAAMPAAVTMATLHADVIMAKCATCHYPGTGGMPDGSGFAYGDYTTPAKTQMAMVNKKSLYAGTGMTLMVVDQMAATTAAKLANSSLWLKVSVPATKALGHKGPKGESTGARMPNDGTPFTDADKQKVKDWICRGSPEM